ncbi:MAG: ribosome recycling factor [Bacteriovoracaceae bacterium]|nr:ribosome recycling factor [Bacteriovoracaceae bacterium]
MWEEIESDLSDSMNKAIDSLKYQLTRVRTGRASESVLDGITVDYYGTLSPINQVGQVSTPEARLLQIQPYDKTMIASIEKAIMAANIGATPSNDGNIVRIPFPALTEEKRKQQVKEIKKLGEDAKIGIRNIRREQNEAIKKAEKDKKISEDELKKYQNNIQEITDKFVKETDQIILAKEKEIFTI